MLSWNGIRSRKKEKNAYVLIRDHAQNMTNPAISVVAYNVIPLLVGPPARAPITSIVYHVSEGTRPCPIPVTGNGHGRVPSPTSYTVEVIGARADGPIRRGMT